MVEQASVGVPFWILSVIVLVSGFMVVSLKNIFHCALFLIFCLTGVAGIFVLLNAEFLAAAQVLIYVGAVCTLMIFAIMLTSNMTSKKIIQTNHNAMVAFFGCMIFTVSVVAMLWITTRDGIWHMATELLPENNVLVIGQLLMTKFVVPFEVVSIVLLAAMIGAIVLARGEKA
ncbi:MAG: NADH-quinone oxidoreductase subunit J [Candidatus Zixiibacteriota bacterium]|nr:MAG: NADH-quinone oxidoreductase subunit J [candidate division Zixibacteria bacterium]